MTNLMTASRQWATRPADERFWGLADLRSSLFEENGSTFETTADIRTMRVETKGDDLCLVGSKNVPTHLTHWAFNQLSGLCDAPANYLRSLPVDLAAQNLNHGLKRIGDDNAQGKLLLHKNGQWTARAITSPQYGRIWNLDIVDRLRPALENGWMVPPARPSRNDDPRARAATEKDIVPGQESFGLSVKVGDTIAPAGVYAGDRDMFIFLVNPKRIIDDGEQGLMRGVFIWNSEVGAGAFKVKTFYLENVCGNHIVWGASNITEIKIIHRQNAIVGFDRRTLAKLQTFADQSNTIEEGAILAARSHELGANREEVVEKVFGMKALALSKKDIEGAYETAVQWEHTAHAPPTTVWGMVHGLTRFSQATTYADARHKLDVAAGKLLALAV